MTYIEFFDKTASENICASLANAPDRVVLVGDKMKLLQKHSFFSTEALRLNLFVGPLTKTICRI